MGAIILPASLVCQPAQEVEVHLANDSVRIRKKKK